MDNYETSCVCTKYYVILLYRALIPRPVSNITKGLQRKFQSLLTAVGSKLMTKWKTIRDIFIVIPKFCHGLQGRV